MKDTVKERLKPLQLRIFIYAGLAALVVGYLILCSLGLGLSCFVNDTVGVMCHSCGGTRALMHLLTFDFGSAVNMHPVFALVLYPAVMLLIVQDLIISVYNAVKNKREQSMLTFVFGKRVEDKQ